MSGTRLMHCVVLSYIFYTICVPLRNSQAAADSNRIDLTEVYKKSPFVEQTFQDPHFYERYSNLSLCMNTKTDILCSCQPLCMSYGTCCLDYLWYKRKWNSIDAYMSNLVSGQKKRYFCTPIGNHYKDNIKITFEHISMITTCPNDGTTTTVNSSSEILPTYGNDKHVYMNPAMAQCHGVHEYKLIPLDVICRNTLVNKTMKSKHLKDVIFTECNYTINKLAINNVRTCSPQNSCQGLDGDSNKLNANACRSYLGRVKINEILYENLHCSLCDNTTGHTVSIWDPPSNIEKYIPMPYSTVINLGSGPPTALYDNKGQKIKITVDCKKNEIYNVITAECVPFVCSVGYKQSGFKCIKEIKNTGNDDVNARITSKDGLKTRLNKCLLSEYHDAHVVVKVIKTVEAERVWSLLQEQNITLKKITNTIFTLYKENQTSIQQLRDILSRENYTSKEVSPVVTSVQIIRTKIYATNVRHYFPNNALCFAPLLQQINDSVVSVDSKCNLKTGNKRFTPEHYIITLNDNNKLDLITCSEYHLHDSCPKSIISSSDYTLYGNGSIALYGKTVLSASKYTPTVDGISVCIDNYVTGESGLNQQKPTWLKTMESVEGYLTMAACIISIIFYILTIYVYLRTKEFREIPGRNIVCVCMTLLSADVFVLVSGFMKRGTLSCYIVAVVLYFFLLCAQCWCTVVAFEIWFTLRKHTSARFIYSPKRFIWYCVYAFLTPLVITLMFSSADSTNALDIGYGKGDHCWIGDFYFRLYLYLIPVIIASCFNISVLSSILHVIYRQQRKSKQLLHKTNDNDDIKIVTTALKLVVLLGVVEIIGFIQVPGAKSTVILAFNFVMRFLFTVLRGFRGLFIWLLFVYMDKRAWKNFKCNNDGRENSPQDTPTMATKSSRASYKLTYNVRDTRF